MVYLCIDYLYKYRDTVEDSNIYVRIIIILMTLRHIFTL